MVPVRRASPTLECDATELRHDNNLEAALRDGANGRRNAHRAPSFQSRDGHPRDVQPFGKIGLLKPALFASPSDGSAELRHSKGPGMIHMSIIEQYERE
jgi:hypothetical protein